MLNTCTKNVENEMRDVVKGNALKTVRPASDQRRSTKRAYGASATRRSCCRQRCLSNDGVINMKMPRQTISKSLRRCPHDKNSHVAACSRSKTVRSPLPAH